MNEILKKNNHVVERSEILISKTIDVDIPAIIIDFDLFNLVDLDYRKQALSMIDNFSNFKVVYTTSKDDLSLSQIKNYNKLADWTYNAGEKFLCDLADLPNNIKHIQLCGIFRELCLVEVAALIKNSALNLEPIIIDNDDYTISAAYSVLDGDTIDNRLMENGFKPKYIIL